MKHFRGTVILQLHLFYLTCTFLLACCEAASSNAEDPCGKVEIVSKEEWKARPRRRWWRMKTPVNMVIIKHTATQFCHTKQQCARNVQSMQDYQMDERGWPDIAYNFMVGGDGRIYEGTGWRIIGAHFRNFTESIGIGFIGDYMEVEPGQEMLDAALNLIKCGVRKGYLTPIHEMHGHRDVSCTLSPGDKLYAIIRTWGNYKGEQIPLSACS